MSKVLVQTNSVYYIYYRKSLLKDINLRVDSNDVMLITGSSGSGKTHLVNLLSGITRPTKGSFILLDKNIVNEPYLFNDIRCSWLEPTLYLNNSIEKNLNFFAALYDIDKRYALKKINELLKTFNLYEKRKKFISSLSFAERKKVDLCRAFLGEFKLLILHEPLLYLDSVDIKAVLDYLKSLHKNNIGIIIVVSNIEPFSDLATKVTVLKNGKQILNQKVSKILERRESVVVLKPKNSIDIEKLAKSSIIKHIIKVNDYYHLRLNTEIKMSELSQLLELYGIEIESLSLKQNSLQASVEEVILNA